MRGKIISLNRVLTVLASIGILSGIYMLILDQRPSPESQPITPPSISPFESFISGAGIVEAASENIGLGAMVSATVDQILVKKGQIVSKGTPVFTLDSRQVIAALDLAKAQLEVAQATVEQAKATLKYAQDDLNLVTILDDKRGVTKEEIINRQDNVIIAQAALKSAEASVVAARATVNETQTVLAFYTVTAPIDCEIMQINIHPGEFVGQNSLSTSIVTAANTISTPYMLIGNVSSYHVRVDVDENDAWRFNKDEPAVAYLRGNILYNTPLKFEYIDPYVIPKSSFTGDPTERVDTRVLQVIYSYDPKKMPSYLGQEVDVYIKAAKVGPNVRYGGPLPISR
ncbi:MAG: biotin/lipoyl-binding protein [Alphaproteobacteria bacterium]|nr:biotin/lipoyl-binding protein [Alphaproteobacteria bacterium]